MQSLATRQSELVSGNQELIRLLPGWLKYLVGAYPSAKPNAHTFIVYEDQFSDATEREMMQAVKEAVKFHSYNTFPGIAELRAIVDRNRAHEAAIQPLRANLNRMREELLERAYQGDIDVTEWLFMVTLLKKKRPFAAQQVERKYMQFTGEELRRPELVQVER